MTSAQRELERVLDDLTAVFDDIDPIADAFAALVAERRRRGAEPNLDDLAKLRPAITRVLTANRGWVAGTGVITRPGLLAGTPRWLEWWWTRSSGAPEALRVNLDESAADFFDYTSAEWWAVPERTRTRHAAGPYVDHLCTNEYSVTLSAPVHLGEELIGMVGADVLVASIEARVTPVLRRAGADALLINAEGRVIAAATPRYAPGLRVDVPARRRGRRGVEAWRLAYA
jgi:hypothetical protein